MKIGFLHTAQIHVATFDAILDGSGVQAMHHVDADLLARAQIDGIDAARQGTSLAIAELSDADAILCTCSTLGPLIEGIDPSRVLRIDHPAFAKAVAIGPRSLLVICLDSTKAASEGLLADCAARSGTPHSFDTLVCGDAWPHFEAGNLETFHTLIADAITTTCARTTYDAVILGQASMAGSSAFLSGLDAQVLATPKVAVAAVIAAAKARA